MNISKSQGFTRTERLLAAFSERTFLNLWTYPNVFKDDGHELCDLLAVFENHVFIFFDRENKLSLSPDKEPLVLWQRWKRNVIDRQVRTAHGAERYIRSRRPIFLDSKNEVPFPLSFDLDKIVVHKIIVAHGAKEACQRFSGDNVYGSLGIRYCTNVEESPVPFVVDIDKNSPVHIFDSHNLPVVLGELDTVYDLTEYLDAKLAAISALDHLLYCGEEDLLAHYLLNVDRRTGQHFIGTADPKINYVMIGEGEWLDFSRTEMYRRTKRENEVSYLWDDLIQRTCKNALNGTLMGNSDVFRGQSAILEMAKEPRFFRRALAEQILRSIENFPENLGRLARSVSFMPSFYKTKGYVFFQLKADQATRMKPDYREKRQAMLEIACAAAKNNFPHLTSVIGIAIDAPKYVEENSEDFLLLPCRIWTRETRAHYEAQNEGLDFFRSPSRREWRTKITEFVRHDSVHQPATSPRKLGRNDPCSCGSGKKFKKCCGG